MYFAEAQLELMQANAPKKALLKHNLCWAFSYHYLSQDGMLDEMLQLGLDNPYPFSTKGFAAQYAALANFDSSDYLAKIKKPVLVIAGDQDFIFNEVSIHQLADRIPNVKHHCFKNCGHLPHTEYPDEYISVLTKFIEAQAEAKT